MNGGQQPLLLSISKSTGIFLNSHLAFSLSLFHSKESKNCLTPGKWCFLWRAWEDNIFIFWHLSAFHQSKWIPISMLHGKAYHFMNSTNVHSVSFLNRIEPLIDNQPFKIFNMKDKYLHKSGRGWLQREWKTYRNKQQYRNIYIFKLKIINGIVR